MTDSADASPNPVATANERPANEGSRPRSRYHEAMPSTNIDDATYPAASVCTNLGPAIGLKKSSLKLVSSIRIVSRLNSAPTGFCIHALAIRIHNAEKFEPSA